MNDDIIKILASIEKKLDMIIGLLATHNLSLENKVDYLFTIGLTSKQIGLMLNLSDSTIRGIKARTKKKTETTNSEK